MDPGPTAAAQWHDAVTLDRELWVRNQEVKGTAFLTKDVYLHCLLNSSGSVGG